MSVELNHQRARRKGFITHQHGHISISNFEDELDPWTAWAYKPRTITLLLIGACFLVWASGALDPEHCSQSDIVTSVKRGIWAMIAIFLAYSLLQAPSTVLTRPHPAMWRLVHGTAVIYLVALTFLLFHRRDDARQFMKFLHPDLGIELPERSYGSDCRIYVPEYATSRFMNVYETLFDEFVVAHILGWWGKAIMIRNEPLLWVLSIGFELMEVFGPETYEWVGISRQPNIMGKSYSKRIYCCCISSHVELYANVNEELGALPGSISCFRVKRTLGQFTPARWDKDEWHPLLGPFRFVQVGSVLWWLRAIPTILEYNSYLQDRKQRKKLGSYCWLSLAICIVELLICIKFGYGLFPNDMPTWLVIFWTCVGFGLVIFLGAWSCQLQSSMKRKRQ